MAFNTLSGVLSVFYEFFLAHTKNQEEAVA